MTDWPSVAAPCADEPWRWEVPGGLTTRDAVERVYRVVAESVRECRSCPALQACGEWAARFPPQNQVQAGVIWGADCKPRTTQTWLHNAWSNLRYHKAKGAA